MKIDRLIGILSVLLQREKVTTAELAKKFEVSYRTISRDIDDICRAGIPIVTSSGKFGGISIMEGYKIDRTLLSKEDMTAIFAGLNELDSVCETNRYRCLMEKLSAENTQIIKTDNHIIVDLSKWGKSAVSGKIRLIKAAIENDEKISFEYFSPDEESSRVVDPYHLIFQWSGWYVWGYCEKRSDYRTFKLTRMADLQAIGEKRGVRDVPVYIPDKLQDKDGSIEAVVKFDKTVKWRVIDDFGTELTQPDDEGNIIIKFSWSDAASFLSYILTFGDCAEIISPREYRGELLKRLESISMKYK